MEEKILITSELDKKFKSNMFYSICALLVLAFILLIISLFISYPEYDDIKYFTDESFGDYYFSSYHGELSLVIVHWICLLLAGGIALIYWALSKCELILTDKNVKGKVLFGKEVIFPIHMISAYSTRRFLSTVAITTTSGIIKFSLLGNYKDIGNILQNLINERQSITQMFVPTIPMENTDKLDELKKLKDLLDNGIISQEDFDTKKKQILGL